MKIKIKITYPEDFALQGWDKALFDVALKRVFAADHFSVYKLEQLRKKLTAARATRAQQHMPDEDKSVEDLEGDLNLLSYLDFSEMGPDILQALPGKVGLYLGVQVEWAWPAPSLSYLNSAWAFYRNLAVLGVGLLVCLTVALTFFLRPNPAASVSAFTPTRIPPGASSSFDPIPNKVVMLTQCDSVPALSEGRDSVGIKAVPLAEDHADAVNEGKL